VQAHDDAVSCLFLHNDLLFSGSWDSTVKVWQFKSSGVVKSPIAEFYDNETEVKSICGDPTGKLVVYGAEDGSIVFADLRQPATIRTVSAHSKCVAALAFSAGGDRIVTCSHDNHLKIWDLNGSELLDLNLGNRLNSLKTDGNFALVAGSDISGLWDLQSGKQLRQFKGNSPQKSTAVIASKNGNSIIFGASDGSLSCWKKT